MDDSQYRIEFPTATTRFAEGVVTANRCGQRDCFGPRDNRIFIRDRNSANGVYVNGVPIGVDTALVHGDVIRTGSTTLRYEMPSGRRTGNRTTRRRGQ
ncbi:FHA domain-containing protein [Nocardia sp. NPDC004278]